MAKRFPEKRCPQAEAKPSHDAPEDRKQGSRRTFLVGLARGTDDTSLADREALILRRLLLFLEEIVVEVAIGIGRALEVAQLDLGLAGIAGLGDQRLHVFFERGFAALGDRIFAAIGIGDAVYLVARRFAQFFHAVGEVDGRLMSLAVTGRPIGILGGEIEILGAK